MSWREEYDNSLCKTNIYRLRMRKYFGPVLWPSRLPPAQWYDGVLLQPGEYGFGCCRWGLISVFFQVTLLQCALWSLLLLNQSAWMKKLIASPAGIWYNQNTAVIGGIDLRLVGGAIMELRVLGYFLAVAREENFTRAAEQKASATRNFSVWIMRNTQTANRTTFIARLENEKRVIPQATIFCEFFRWMLSSYSDNVRLSIQGMIVSEYALALCLS